MAILKTAGVKALVDEVIDNLSNQPSKHVILVVFQEIESNPGLLNRYDILRKDLGESVVNQWIGRWTQRILDAESIRQMPAEGTTLTQTYSTLRLK